MSIYIIITGPESSGKTTLALALAKVLETKMVPEFARSYLAHLGRKYRHDDLKTILEGQKAWCFWYKRKFDSQVLIIDTDWTVIRIWEQFRYGEKRITEQEQPTQNAHYLLCAPDIPWDPDPLREHQKERDRLFELYRELLVEIQAPFTIIQGNAAERLENSLSSIQKFF